MSAFLTLRQAAERVCTSPETVRYWVHIGRLRAFKPGRSVLIREDDLLAMVEASEVGAARHLRAVATKRGGSR